MSAGDDFQNKTKHTRQNLRGRGLDWANKPETYKTYPGAKTVPLPKEFPTKSLPIDEILRNRKSIRTYSTKPVSLSELAFLLWASTGIQRVEHRMEFRTSPSAGALYPIETYLVINNVEGLEQGIYHYNIQAHVLEQLKVGFFGQQLADASLGQLMVAESPVAFVWTGVFERSKWKYMQRAYRYVYLDAGIVGENLALASVGVGFGSCQIGAFFDDEVNELLEVDGEKESVLYLSVVGHPLRP
jgi:SagB-type dehydrogenase family enzyme